jgi:uncharacterized phage protein (TIGR01671 family)
MRDIKFRAWDKTTKLFDYWTLKPGVEVWIHSGHEEIQEFTGLLDKNGKEIYEGDIIASTENPDIWQAIVYFEFGSFKVKDTKSRIGGQHIMYGELYEQVGDEGNDFEVIGNIYENKELLK